MNIEGPHIISNIVNELVDMEFKSQVKAIACVVVDSDGDLRTLTAFEHGTRLAIIAGAAIMHARLVSQVPSIEKERP